MKTSTLALMLTTLPLGMGAAQAALVINPGDLQPTATGATYTYNLTYDEMATGTVFNNDVFARDGMSYQNEGEWSSNTAHYIRAATGWNTAWFTYKFELPATPQGYTISSAAIQDTFFCTQSGTLSTASWSTSNGNWTKIWSLDSNSAVQEATNQVTIPLPAGTTTLYYHVDMQNAGGFWENYAQWNRLWNATSDADHAFQVTLTLVPEPSAALLLLAGAVLALKSRRGRPAA